MDPSTSFLITQTILIQSLQLIMENQVVLLKDYKNHKINELRVMQTKILS